MPTPSPTSETTIDSRGANVLITDGHLDPEVTYTELRLAGGRIVRLLTSELLQSQTANVSARVGSEDERMSEQEGVVIPLVEEKLHVGRRTIETGKVRLRKTVHEYETQLDEVLAVRTFDIDRIVLNQPVESAPPVRQEGRTTVYPVVEEQLILTRQLVLKEEVHVTLRDGERLDNSKVVLRRESIEVERETLRANGTVEN